MKIKYLFSAIAIQFAIADINGQQIPTGPAIPVSSTPPVLQQHAWYRGGNFPGAAGGIKNVFGTMWNSPIYTQTFGVNRTKLNGTVSYNINGFVAARDGYMLLGPDAPVGGGTLYNTKGAFSLLHLNGTTTLAAIELGYRPWMKTGITFTENSDLMYVGRKSEGTGASTADQTDAVIAWADDGSGPPFFGPDNLRFMFTFGNAAGTSAPNGDLTGGGMDGREVMRMTAFGNVGVGPRFDNLNQPQSTYHQHQEQSLSSWMQITNQRINGGGAGTYLTPTATNANLGFRWGILGSPTLVQNANAFVYNQEKRHIIFSTGFATPTSVNTPTSTFERMRITAIENPTNLATGGYGVNNPAGLGTTTTRVAISENPTLPIVRPLSLLHIGYDVGFFSGPGSLDGWRPWMDIGTFIGAGIDNMYIGMKQEGPSADRSDAVINWGDNQTAIPSVFNGPDNLRFIFTANASFPGGTTPATGANGLETGRFFPGRDTLGTFGRFGVGDFTATGVNQNPTHKIDVVGNGRFRFLPDSIYRKDTLVQKIVFVDSLGVLRWEYADSLNLGQGGNACGAATTNPLTSDWELPMGDFNYHFSDGSSTNPFNNVGIGTNCNALTARLQVVNPVMRYGIDATTTTALPMFPVNYGIRGNAINNLPAGLEAIGVEGNAITTSPIPFHTGINGNARGAVQTNYGGKFFGGGLASTNIGAQVFGAGTSALSQNTGLNANASGGMFAYGVLGRATSASSANFGGWFISTSTGPAVNIGVYGEAANGSTNYAGYFNGDVFCTTGNYLPSDINLKENIDTIRNADSLLNLLKPVYFTFKQTGDATRFNFTTNQQMGLLAQEVESVLPNIVKEATHPALCDTTGTIISPAYTFKTVDYQKIIPLLIAGYKGQQAKIDSLKRENSVQDSINTYLNSRDSIFEYRLDQLESALNACCNSHSMQQNNNSNHSSAQQDVNLKDGQTVVLQQNLPNPFAEQTTINYFLPTDVVKAQMLFYNTQGKLIQSVDLNDRGECSLNVFAQDLSNGIYTYTIVVDGKIFETKKMVKQQ